MRSSGLQELRRHRTSPLMTGVEGCRLRPRPGPYRSPPGRRLRRLVTGPGARLPRLSSDLAGCAVVVGDQERRSRRRAGPNVSRRPRPVDGPTSERRLRQLRRQTWRARDRGTETDRVAHVERAALNQHGRDGTAPLSRVGFDIWRRRGRLCSGLASRVRAASAVSRTASSSSRECPCAAWPRCSLVHDVAAVLFGDQAVLGELGADLFRIRAFALSTLLTATTIGVGCLRVVDGFNRLRA